MVKKSKLIYLSFFAGAPGWNDDGATASAPGWNDTGASANASGWNGNGFAGAVDSAFDPSFKDDNQDDNDNKCRFCSEGECFFRRPNFADNE